MTRGIPQSTSILSSEVISEEVKNFCMNHLGDDTNHPFLDNDITAGVENELQAAVEGSKTQVDLPLALIDSSYYRNSMQRAARGDLSSQSINDFRMFLEEKQEQIWENSWVRFPKDLLGEFALQILERDLLADKNNPEKGDRGDKHNFLFSQQQEAWLRIPISYLLKLSLAEAVSEPGQDFPFFRILAKKLMHHFISDNISPEITSFVLVQGRQDSTPGDDLAKEVSRRFLFIQLLIRYAEKRYQLEKYGQRVHLYFSPTVPVRQKKLNQLISDELYRKLFLNPCLSGWPQGEEKKEYMGLCHRTLCRSQLNTITSLKEAGIITNNLVVIPNTSNTSLANNGTHITIGSKTLSQSFHPNNQGSVFRYEKYLGDLVIKIMEHFLPLFAGTYTAAPSRVSFADFHPENVMGFLPHELEPTHLRMIWRRWKKKADLRFLSHNFTPMGPRWLDNGLSRCFRLKGDFIPDSRLIEYFVALQSLESSPALNGTVHNQDILKQNLSEMGIFNQRMAMYLPYRMRDKATYGFSGFEGRHYSLFATFDHLGKAADLQTAITALAFNWAANGHVSHHDIPDTPFIESERRQIFFNTAIGIPTFYVRSDSPNQFLRKILNCTENKRKSRRYKGYTRIKLDAYKNGCVQFLKQENDKLIGSNKIEATLEALEGMLHFNTPHAVDALTSGISKTLGKKRSPIHYKADEFNTAAELFYRTELCSQHFKEGLDTFIKDGASLDTSDNSLTIKLKNIFTGNRRADKFIEETGKRVLSRKANQKDIHHLILLFLLYLNPQIT